VIDVRRLQAPGVDAAAIVGNEARRMAKDLLGRVGIMSAGVIVEITTKDLEPFEPPIDPEAMAERPMGTGYVTDRAGTPHSYECSCGWTTEDLEALVQHLEKHGVQRVVISPAGR
jgi:hypothetical protein